ncbi:MAG: MauE/DoxX family redox-associated membrane protein [Kofleriaceae bacterium]
MTALELGCRALVAVVLGVAAAGKLRDLEAFTETLRDFGVPARLARPPLAVVIASLEVISVALLVAAPVLGDALAFALLAIFTLGLARAARSGRQVACRCFGARTAPVGAAQLVRNAVILAVIGLGFAASLARHAALALPTQVIAIACGALGGAAIVRWDDLAYLLISPVPVRRR